jgi:BlaI family transcriptional regulator, penicillinase repressor
MEETSRFLLTDAELELMLILWRVGEASVHDVRAALPEQKVMAYTTVSTIIRILEKKGFVGSRKVGKGHLYSPQLSKQDYEARTIGHIVNKLFENTPAALVARLINDHELSAAEIAELKLLLDKRG